MSCENCEVKAVVDGEERHVKLLISNIKELLFSKDQVATIYYCDKCQAFWELGGYAKAAHEVDENYLRKTYSQNEFNEIMSKRN